MKLASTVYDIPAVAVTSRLVLTNTAPTVPYRGAGRPEAVYLIERLIDRAAREMGLDPAEFRRRNLIGAFPYQTQTGWTYDSGNYAAAMPKCQALADWDGYAARRMASAAAGGCGAGASSITPTIPASLTSAWNCASTRAAS